MTRATAAKPKPEKEKRRNNEKRKEKSRDAARCRRSRETEIFQELASLLPMRQEDVDHLDKASVMRLSIAYLKVRDMLELFPASNEPKSEIMTEEIESEEGKTGEESEDVKDSKLDLSELAIENEKIALQTLDGFLLVLSADGDVTYISENVSEYLGISQIDMMGQPIWDYSHQCDHEELREALNGRHHSPSNLIKGVANNECKPNENRDFFLRLKCTLTSRGRSVNIKSASYKVIHLTGHIACKENGQRQLVAIARPLPHPSNIEVPLDSSTFLSKHSLDMKFSYVDDKMFALLGYNPVDLMGKPLYDCHHGIDSDHLMGTFKNVISKGQSETARYRFLARTGGYAWVVTQATLIYDKQKPHSIVCVNYVISGVENKDEIYSCAQLEAQQQISAAEPVAPQVATHSAPVAAVTEVANDVVKTSDKVLKENINHSNSNHTNNKPPLEATSPAKEQQKPPEEVNKVVGPATIIKRIPTPATAASVVASSVPRPVSVTAAIFNAGPKKPLPTKTCAAASGGDKPALTVVRKAAQLPQSVTAKLLLSRNQHQSASAKPTTIISCSKPKPATSTIFAPRTEDMNKGFLMFSEEEPGLTMLKDEPDDLTHLAPTAGDACIPLEETGPFFNDVFDDFMIPESYTSLLQDELSSLDSSEHRLGSGSSISVSSVASPITINGTTITTVTHHTTNSSLSSPSSITSSSSSSSSSSNSNLSCTSGTSSNGSSGIGTAASIVSSVSAQNNSPSAQTSAGSNDPFINYRDEISEISHSPHLLSPGLSKSPEGSSIPSLCSPNGSACPEDELAFMTLNMDDDLDLSMRAPYISMSEVDDLPLLTSDDLMWGAPPTSVDGSSLTGSTAGSSSLAMASSKYLIKEEFPTTGHHQNPIPQQQQQGHSESTSKSTVTTNARTDSNSNSSNNNENNCNIGNKIIDSSLAALLCGNVINIQTSTIQLQQQHQQQQQQQQTQSQSGNRQILMQQHQSEVQQHQQQRESAGEKKIKLIESNLVHPMVVITPGYKNSNTIEAWTMNDLLQLNGTNGTSATATGCKLNATVIASIVSKKNGTATHGSNAATILATNANKRALATAEAGDGNSKRVKATAATTGSNSVQQSPTSSPQLLQQLMAPSPVPAKAKAKSKTLLDQSDRWPTGKGNGLQEQASNSVLMNLLVSGCDKNIPKSPPEILIAEDDSSQEAMQEQIELTDDEEDCIPILANPMIGSGALLTIQTDDSLPSHKRGLRGDDFMMTVSPSLLTPSDLELWRAIQQGLDPKKLSTVGALTAAGTGSGKHSKSLAATPPTQLELLHDTHEDNVGCHASSNLLAVLDPAMAISGLRTDDDDDEQDYEMTIPVNEILQNNLM